MKWCRAPWLRSPRRHRTSSSRYSESLPRVEVDAELLERAIANVIANARQWSPPTDPVTVRGAAVDGRVELRVIDHGPGVPAGSPRSDVPPVPAARRPFRAPTASGSAWRLLVDSSKPWMAPCPWRRRTGAVSPWCCRSGPRHDEDPGRRRRARAAPGAPREPGGAWVRRRPRCGRGRGPRGGLGTPSRRGDPRPGAAGHGRRRCHRGSSRVGFDADRRPLRARARAGQDRRARRRCRRLRHEAVRDG